MIPAPAKWFSWARESRGISTSTRSAKRSPVDRELGLWFHKKGGEPKKRRYLVGFTGIDRSKMLDIPPNSFAMIEGFTVLTAHFRAV
jgi:hypothetical protein